jgi:hypothetical protein
LSDISNSLSQMRVTIVLELLTSVGIIVMASLLYVVLKDQGRAVALVALALWVAEAVFLTVKTLALCALLWLSQAPDGAAAAVTAAATAAGASIDQSLVRWLSL